MVGSVQHLTWAKGCLGFLAKSGFFEERLFQVVSGTAQAAVSSRLRGGTFQIDDEGCRQEARRTRRARGMYVCVFMPCLAVDVCMAIIPHNIYQVYPYNAGTTENVGFSPTRHTFIGEWGLDPSSSGGGPEIDAQEDANQ